MKSRNNFQSALKHESRTGPGQARGCLEAATAMVAIQPLEVDGRVLSPLVRARREGVLML